jgi:hypothetical protein
MTDLSINSANNSSSTDDTCELDLNTNYYDCIENLSVLTTYKQTLSQTFSTIVKIYNRFQLSHHTSNSIKLGTNIVESGSKILHDLKTQTKALETLLADCQDFIEEITEDLSYPIKGDYIQATKNGMLSYPGRDFIEKKSASAETKTAETKPVDKVPERVLINEVGYNLKLPIVKNIKHIPPALHYYKNEGADLYPTGIYCNLGNNVIARVPFPFVTDSTKDYSRDHSIRCKYRTKAECTEQRDKMAKFHNSHMRTCNFAHEGDKIIKIGYPSRCNAVPNYGNPQTMAVDIKRVSFDDVKVILLYGLSDVVSSVIWLDHNQVKYKILDNLEVA